MTRFSHPRDIDEYADQVPDKYLSCRVDAHSRTPSSIAPIADVAGGFEEEFLDALQTEGAYAVKTLRCRNKCGITWQQVTDKSGAIIWESGPRYSSAPGYLTKGMGRFTKDMRNRLRAEQIERALERGN